MAGVLTEIKCLKYMLKLGKECHECHHGERDKTYVQISYTLCYHVYFLNKLIISTFDLIQMKLFG